MYKEIQKQFNQIIEYSQHFKGVNSDEIFSNWYKAKEKFIKGFGGELIYEIGDVETSLTEKAIANEVENWLIPKYYRYAPHYYNEDFVKYLKENIQSFATNILNCDYKVSEDKIIPAGCKFTKSFKHFITNEDVLNKVQMLASEITQKCKISGTLCMSVHPLDFLSTSENNHNWRSCHALDGEYRLGNISYMQDECTIVCYIKSKENNVKLPRFPESVPWNSKKWRMLLYVSTDNKMLMAGRQYPFEVSKCMDIIRGQYLKLFTKRTWLGSEADVWTDWHKTYIEQVMYDNGDYLELYDQWLGIPNKLVRLKDLIIDGIGPEAEEDDPCHYNDLLRSNVYTHPYYCYFKCWSDIPQFYIGHSVKCLHCGNEYVYEDNMRCPCCLMNEGEEGDEENGTWE